jgi:outer membrane protein
MDYLRDSAIVEVQKSNVRVLEQTLKQTKDRFNVGEVTRTDVAQSEAQLAAGQTQLLTADANLTTTRSNFRRIIGNEPQGLAPGSPVDRYLPGTLPSAVELGLTQNPNVTAAMFGIDVSYLQVKVNEGALLPTVNVIAAVQQAYEQQMTIFGRSVRRRPRSSVSRSTRAAPNIR